MAKDIKKYSAFIDLLATKQSLDIGSDAYHSALRIFRQEVAKNIKFLRATDRIYIFSDCAYLSISEPANFHKFVSGLRSDLLIEKLFFRSALVNGELEAEEFSSKVDTSQQRKASGTIFGENAVRAFQLHEQTKGIASVSNLPLNDYSDIVVKSAFLDPQEGVVRIIHDFRYVFDDLRHEIDSLDRLRKETKKQNTRSRRIGRYYLTPFITWVNSQSFASISYDEDSRSFSEARPIAEWLIDPVSHRDIRQLQGHENIYYSLAQKMWTDRAHESALFRVFDFIRSRSNLADKIGAANTRIISESLKNELLNYIAE